MLGVQGGGLRGPQGGDREVSGQRWGCTSTRGVLWAHCGGAGACGGCSGLTRGVQEPRGFLGSLGEVQGGVLDSLGGSGLGSLATEKTAGGWGSPWPCWGVPGHAGGGRGGAGHRQGCRRVDGSPGEHKGGLDRGGGGVSWPCWGCSGGPWPPRGHTPAPAHLQPLLFGHLPLVLLVRLVPNEDLLDTVGRILRGSGGVGGRCEDQAPSMARTLPPVPQPPPPHPRRWPT